jgi:hypothetical protein
MSCLPVCPMYVCVSFVCLCVLYMGVLSMSVSPIQEVDTCMHRCLCPLCIHSAASACGYVRMCGTMCGPLSVTHCLSRTRTQKRCA